jgi:hypothetical protein
MTNKSRDTLYYALTQIPRCRWFELLDLAPDGSYYKYRFLWHFFKEDWWKRAGGYYFLGPCSLEKAVDFLDNHDEWRHFCEYFKVMKAVGPYIGVAKRYTEKDSMYPYKRTEFRRFFGFRLPFFGKRFGRSVLTNVSFGKSQGDGNYGSRDLVFTVIRDYNDKYFVFVSKKTTFIRSDW